MYNNIMFPLLAKVPNLFGYRSHKKWQTAWRNFTLQTLSRNETICETVHCLHKKY